MATFTPPPLDSIEPQAPIGKVTSYGYPGDPYGGPQAKATRIGAFGNNVLDDESLAVSPDVEAEFRRAGIQPKQRVTLTLADGSQITRRWDDRTATDEQAAKLGLKPLRGRFDFRATSGRPAFDGAPVVAFAPVQAAEKFTPPPLESLEEDPESDWRRRAVAEIAGAGAKMGAGIYHGIGMAERGLKTHAIDMVSAEKRREAIENLGTPEGTRAYRGVLKLRQEKKKVAADASKWSVAADFMRDVQERAPEDYHVDPAQNDSIASKLIGGAATLGPSLASGPLAPVTTAAMMGEDARQDALRHGASEAVADDAYRLNAPVGALSEALLGVPALLRAAQAARMPAETYRQLVGRVAWQTLKGGAREGVQEGIETTAQNAIANAILGYDAKRGTFANVPESMAIGAVIGAPLGTVAGIDAERGAHAAVARFTPPPLESIEPDASQTAPGSTAPAAQSPGSPTLKSEAPRRASTQPAPSAAETQFESHLATQQGVVRGGPAVVIGAQGAEFPARYAWMPRSQIQPSHSGESLAANPAYPLTNTRDYSDPAEKDKALATRNEWDPRRAITDAPDASVGMPMVARVIDEAGTATLTVAGGNNRQWAMQNLPPEKWEATRKLSNEKAALFGLEPSADPDAQLTRFLGTFDFRKPGERERLQSMVDALNPSPGMVQSTAKRAEIDAAAVPIAELQGVTMDLAPADAQTFVRGLIERGLADRNRTAGIAASGSQSQDYLQRVLVNAAFRQPAIAEARNDPRAGNATLRGLIDAATPALVQLREKGADDVADAIARAFTTTLDYTRGQGIEKLPQALDAAAQQTELDQVHAPAQAIAAALRSRLVLDQKGRVQMEPTLEAARELFGKIGAAVAQHQPGADLFGESRTLPETVLAAVAPETLTVREEPTSGGQSITGDSWVSPSGRIIKTWNHEETAREILGSEYKGGSAVIALLDRGWARVARDNKALYMSGNPTRKQQKAVIDAAIEQPAFNSVAWDRGGRLTWLWDRRNPEAVQEDYLDAKGITDPARRARAADELDWLAHATEDRQLEFGYETKAPSETAPAGERRPGTAAEQTRAEALKRAVGGLRPAEVEALFAEGDTVSGLIAEAVNNHVGFDVRGAVVKSAKDAAALMLPLRTPWFESFKLLVLDDAGVVTHSEILHIGGLNWSDVSVQRIVQAVDMHGQGAKRVLVSHNHPSGQVEPSEADQRVTLKLHDELGKAGITVADHVITDGWGYYSFKTESARAFEKVHVADWEAVPRHELASIGLSDDTAKLAATLRGGDPDAVHVAYLSTRSQVLALQRLPRDISPSAFGERVRRQSAREGAFSVIVSVPDATTLAAMRAALDNLRDARSSVRLLDVSTPAVPSLAMEGWNFDDARRMTEQASALHTLREEPADYSPLQAVDDKGTPYANVPMAGLPGIKIVQMPEVVQLARDMGIDLGLKRLRSARGHFVPIGGGRIRLDPRIFSDPISAAKTLAHEFGHWADWFSSTTAPLTLKRGNTWGRIMAVANFRKELWGTSGPTNKQMRAELIALSDHWKPIDRTASKGYIAYRESAVELYADFISVLFNSPATAKQLAPKFWSQFFAGLDNKPEVKAAFFDLQNWLNRPAMAILKDRATRVDEMFDKAQAIFERKWEERQERYKGFRGWTSRLKQAAYDQFAPAQDRAAQAGGPAAAALKYLFDSHPLADNRIYRWLERMHRTVLAPAEAAGFGMDDVGRLLFFNRVANESYPIGERMAAEMGIATGGRSVIANPQGHTPATARMGLLAMRLENGLRAQTLLDAAVQKFHDEVFDVMQEANAAGMLTPAQWELIQANRDHYATFTPLEYVDAFVPAGIFPQSGTLKEIQNPFVSTVLKVITMHRAIEMQRVKAATVNLLQRSFPGEIAPAQTRKDPTGREHPVPPRERGVSQIMIREQGRPQWWNVPAEIALMFEKVPTPLIDSLMSVLDWPFRKIFYPAFITYNPLFQLVRNPLRDVRRSYLNVPQGIGLWDVARQLPLLKHLGNNPAIEGVQALIRRGEQTPLIAEMLDNLAITPGDATFLATAGKGANTTFDKLLQRYGLIPEEAAASWFARSKITAPVRALARGLVEIGKLNELLPKANVYHLLTSKLGWHPKDAAYYVRNYIGTPNFTRKGKHIQIPADVLPFINVWMQGWSADAELARRGFQRASGPDVPGKSAASWWFRWALTSGIWTVLKAAATLGLLGAGIKELFDGVSSHYKTNYDVLPIGTIAGGDHGRKTVFTPLPKDPTDRLISGIAYTSLRALMGNAAQMGVFGDEVKEMNAGVDFSPGKALAKDLSLGVSDMPGLNPVLKIAAGWKDYLTGQNPLDSYRHQFVLSDKEHLAGGLPGLEKMLHWTYQQSGLQGFVAYDPQAQSAMEITAQLPVINGMLKVSDYGHKERQMAAERMEDAAAARTALGMPANAQRLNAELSLLRGLGREDRSGNQEARYRELSVWHSHHYKPAEELIRGADDNGISADQVKALRAQIERESKPFERQR